MRHKARGRHRTLSRTPLVCSLSDCAVMAASVGGVDVGDGKPAGVTALHPDRHWSGRCPIAPFWELQKEALMLEDGRRHTLATPLCELRLTRAIGLDAHSIAAPYAIHPLVHFA